jgi:Group II intron, maturase-specific domain
MAKVGDLLVPSNIDPWPHVRAKLNRSLRGWSNYFGYGSRGKAYRSVDLVNDQDVRCHAARSTRVSISLRSITKSMGLVRSASAPPSNALRFVSASLLNRLMVVCPFLLKKCTIQ